MLLSYIETPPKASMYVYIYRTYMFIRNPGRSNMDWNSYQKPFSAEIWAALLAVILVLSACIFIDIKIGCKYGDVSGNTSRLRLCDSLLYVYYCFCQQSKYNNCFILLLSVWAVCHNNTLHRSNPDARTKSKVNKCEDYCLPRHGVMYSGRYPPSLLEEYTATIFRVEE
jgi:hypothetical protein